MRLTCSHELSLLLSNYQVANIFLSGGPDLTMASATQAKTCHGASSVRKTDLEEFEYYPDASWYFAIDAAVDLEARPKVRKDAESEPDSSAPLKVTLLRLVCTVKQYGNHKGSTGVDVWQMVVMDGSHSLCKGVINSSVYSTMCVI
jgi:hypothetical protein